MKLESIEVKNYRSLFRDGRDGDSFQLDLGDGMNAIAGPNNVGKSNVFRALALALDPDFSFDRSLDMPSKLTWAKPTVTLTFRVPTRGRAARERTLLSRVEAYEHAVQTRKGQTYASDGLVKFRVTIEGADVSTGTRRQVFVARGAGGRSLPDDDELAKKALEQFHSCFHFVLISSGQSLESLMEGKFRDILHNVLRDNLRNEYGNAESSRQDYLSDLQSGLLHPLTQRISAEVKDLFPEIGDVQLTPEVLGLDETLAKMRVKVSDAAVTDLADKGTGVRGGLIIAMLRHFADVGKRSMLFAVEEPESFLHPAAQEQLREDLEALSERPDVSLLVTTHSPYIVSRMPESKVFALNKDATGRTVVSAEAVGAEPRAAVLGGLYRDRLFVEWLDRAQSVPPDARLVLVVEGYTDRAFAELALERAGRLELLEGIAFMDASVGQASGGGGANLAVMQALLARSLAPASVAVAALFDNDGPGRTCEQMLKEIGSKTNDWKLGRTLFSYRDVFSSNNKAFEFEAEDLWPQHLHESFKAVGEHAAWLKREEQIPNPDGGRQYDWVADAKGALLEHLRKTVTADDCAKWVQLYEKVRSGTGINAPVGTAGAQAAPQVVGHSQESGSRISGSTPAPEPDGGHKTAFLAAVRDAASPALEEYGLSPGSMHARGAYLRIPLPSSCGLKNTNAHLVWRVTQQDAMVDLVVNGFETRASNILALKAIRGRYDEPLTRLVPSGVNRWTGGRGDSLRAYAQSLLPGGGYVSGSPETTALWAVSMSTAWVDVLSADPMPEINIAEG